MYTFSGTPKWAALTPDSDGLYGSGSNSKVKDVIDSGVFLDAMMSKYQERITSYEVWNEPDYSGFYLGSAQDLVDITKAMIAARNKIASKPKIVGPGFTHLGVSVAEDYYRSCGENCPDAIGWHYYSSQTQPPEDMLADFANVVALRKWAGKESLPILNTEFGVWSNINTKCVASVSGEIDSATILARSVLLMAGLGLESFSYYVWDRPESSDICSLSTEASKYKDPTPVGEAYARVKQWLLGAKILDSWIQFEDVYALRLIKDNKEQLVLWKSGTGEKKVHLPAAYAALTSEVNLKGDVRSIPNDRYVVVSGSPLLIK